jgi:hypothetical protein
VDHSTVTSAWPTCTPVPEGLSRNILIDTSLSAQPFGRETPLSFLWEKFITWWNYHGIENLTPTNKGIFEGTPVVNDNFLDHVRSGRCEYIRGDTKRLTANSVVVNVRGRNSKSGDEGQQVTLLFLFMQNPASHSLQKEFLADIVVLATGFELPKIDFLPETLFPENYEVPCSSIELLFDPELAHRSVQICTYRTSPPASPAIVDQTVKAHKLYRGLVDSDDELVLHERHR